MKDYQALLADAQADPEGADFHSLRMAYARSDAYEPYGGDAEAVEALRVGLRQNQLELALGATERLLARNYLDIEAHMAADYVHTVRGEAEQAAYHRTFAKGLIAAILATGDGQDTATAYVVLSVPEEYTALRMRGLVPGQQALLERDGHWFDVFTARHPQGEGQLKVFFNVDLPHAWLEAHHHE